MNTSNHIRFAAVGMMILSIPLCGHAQGIVIGRGANMVMTDEIKLVLQDASFVNYGRFAAGKSTVLFTSQHSLEKAIIGGHAPIAFHNLSINRPAGLVLLENELSISGVLAMQGGNLELNRHNINLGRTGSISGENLRSYITGTKGGTISVLVDLRSPNAINPGNIGVALTSTADLGTTLITRGHVQQGEQSIYRYYDIKPAINTSADINLRFHYLDAEMGANNKSELVVWSNAGNTWTAEGKDNITANSIEKNNVKALNRFTLGRSVSQKLMQAYPNPAQNMITAVVSSAGQSQSVILLQDHLGNTLEQKKVNLRAGINTIQWNLSKYAGGTYYLAFENGGSMKIVKQ